ncbi:MAG: hypothetical protein GY847_42030 [Proteobacteria bacterium]|nr:hypothetical protein [Pseudomonadota bacterium]
MGKKKNVKVAGQGLKASVSERALMQRINRKLAPERRGLRKSRGWRAEHELGEYWILDFYSNFADELFIDLEDYGRELGALKEWEKLADDE